MQWLGRWLQRQIDDSNLNVANKTYPSPKLERVEVDDSVDLYDGMRIAIKSVVGGKLVTFTTNNRQTDRRETKTYIIVDDADFNKELGHIITLETMRM